MEHQQCLLSLGVVHGMMRVEEVLGMAEHIEEPLETP